MCDHCGCRQFAPIAELTADHEHILELAWRVAETGGPGDAAWETARGDLVALLAVHAAKEETGLYPLLAGTGDLDRAQRAALEEEHRVFHDALGSGAFGRTDYYALATHTEEEETELFPAAKFAFDEDDWDEMARAHHAALHEHGVAHSHEPGARRDLSGSAATPT